MKQYIDKAAVVAEIERLISNGQIKLKESEERKDYESYVALAERIATCINILSFIDTIEVEEEGTTTDAFIEKAWNWIEDNILSSNQQDKSRLYYKQFTNYIKGE